MLRMFTIAGCIKQTVQILRRPKKLKMNDYVFYSLTTPLIKTSREEDAKRSLFDCRPDKNNIIFNCAPIVI